jgi:hypothetical protein
MESPLGDREDPSGAQPECNLACIYSLGIRMP